MKKLLIALIAVGFAGTLCFAADTPNVAVKEPAKTVEVKPQAPAPAAAVETKDKAAAKATTKKTRKTTVSKKAKVKKNKKGGENK